MDISEMVNKIKETTIEDKLVVFIGAGVSANSGYKSWQDLIREMDRIIKYSLDPEKKNYNNDELLKIPEYLEEFDNDTYKKVLTENFGFLPDNKNVIIDKILELKPHHIITTNFDSLIEQCISENNRDPIKKRKQKPYAVIKKNQDLISINKNNLIIKMHGDIEAFDDLVLKEKDYLDYSKTHCLIETYIKSLLIDHSFLFIGYNIADYNLKLILNWFESIISEYKFDQKNRKKHYFINSNETTMSEYDKQYFNKKNVEIIDSIAIPEEYRELIIDDISDERGKKIYRTIRYILENKPTNVSIEYVCDKLKWFSSCSKVLFQDLQNLCDIPSFYNLINDELHYYGHTSYSSEFDVIVSVLQHKPINDAEEFIHSIFIKAGINKLVDDAEDKIHIISEPHGESDLYNAIAEKDFNTIRRIKINKDTDILISLYLKMFLGDNPEYIYQDINPECFNLIQHAILLQNAQLDYSTTFDSTLDFFNVLSKEEKYYISAINDLNDGFNNLISHIAMESIKMQQKYSPYSGTTVSEHIENYSYKAISTQIINTMKYFINNGVYTFGCYRSSCNLGGFSEAMLLYIDNLLFFQSQYCDHAKYESIEISKDDIIAITSYIEKKDLKLIIKKYNVSNLDLQKSNIDYLLLILSNVIEEQCIRIDHNNTVEHYLSQVALTVCELLNICLLDVDQTALFIKIASKIVSIIHSENCDFIYVMIRELRFKLLEMLIHYSWKTYDTRIINYLEDMLHTIFQAFNNEDHEQSFSSIFKNIIEPRNMILNICNVLREHKIIINSKTTNQFVENCMSYTFYKDVLIDIYPICNGQLKEQIRLVIANQLKSLKLFYLYMAIERQIIFYDTNIEEYLIYLCKKQVTHQKIDDSGYWDSPLYVVLRLKEKGFIDSLDNFKQFATKNYFFNFVCFPNEFDYNFFNVNWYSWLELKEYSAPAIANAKSILKNKFEEAINNGTTESVKATYYRLFYDMTD